ncbi:MAG: hypothetical protein K8953_02390, partial [Proteobacteria bacterium]|nr:hypothetical protein [Pseudomonadota bacterium]
TIAPERCGTTITRVCGDKPFSSGLCYAMDNAYELIRVDLCLEPSVLNSAKDPSCRAHDDPNKDGNDGVVEDYCRKDAPNAGTNMRCNAVVKRECGDLDNGVFVNPFDSLCDMRYAPARTIFCLDNNPDTNPPMDGSRCPNLIANHCAAHPFDASLDSKSSTLWCADYGAQRTELVKNCQDTPQTTTGCDAIFTLGAGMETVANCIADPFLTACLDGSGMHLSILSGARTTYCAADTTLFQMKCDNYVGTTRTDLVRQCNSGTPEAKCRTVIVSGTTSVLQCIEDPFDDACSTMEPGAQVRTIRIEFKDLVENACLDDTDNTAGHLFSPLCVNDPTNDDLKDTRDDYCTDNDLENIFRMNCTGRDEVDRDRARAVTRCTPDETGQPTSRLCNRDIKLSDADDALTLGDCIDEPYLAGCRNDLFDGVRVLVAANCFASREDATPATGCGTEVVANGLTVAQCINNPFHDDCADDGFNVVRGDRNALCGAKISYFNPLCDEYRGIDSTRAGFVNECIANKDRATNMDCAKFVNACLDDPYHTDAGSVVCQAYPAFDGARLTHCGIGDNVKTVTECGELDTANNGCISNPFATACVADYRALRTVRVDYCRNLGSATAAADSFCAEAILDTCSNTYTAADNNVASFPFDS